MVLDSKHLLTSVIWFDDRLLKAQHILEKFVAVYLEALGKPVCSPSIHLSSLPRTSEVKVAISLSDTRNSLAGEMYYYWIMFLNTTFIVSVCSLITPGTSRAGLLEAASIIIWDEFPMANIAVIEAVHNVCCTLKQSDKPFGGIPFIGIGDFRQVGPVVKGTGPSATFNACVKASFLWPLFRIFSLHHPIRSAADPEYTEFVDAIGENTHDNYVSLHLLEKTNSTEEAINFLFPPNVLTDPSICLGRAFLSPRNIYVDEFNQAILDRLPEEESKYLLLSILAL